MAIRRRLLTAICAAVMITVSVNVWAQGSEAAGADKGSVIIAPQSPAASLDKRALDALKAMSDTLAQAKTVRFQARSMVPVRAPGGVWINLYGTSQVAMQGPDKLFAGTAGDFAPYDFYFDGKTITAYSPAKNLYAVKPAQATINAMIEEAYRVEGKSFAYADILVSEPYMVLTKGLTRALYVGQSTIRPLSGSGSVKTDHLVFSNKGVEWQIWIGAEDHLPRMVCATYLDDASEPSYTVEFGDWKLNEQIVPETFIFNNTSQAALVEFRDPVQGRRVIPVYNAVKK